MTNMYLPYGCAYCISSPKSMHEKCINGKITKKDKLKIVCGCKKCNPGDKE